MTREMVKVVLYEDGEYEVIEVDPHYRTQRMVGAYGNRHFEMYYCSKDKWKYYLLRLLSTDGIDYKIRKLKERKKVREELAAKIRKELGL